MFKSTQALVAALSLSVSVLTAAPASAQTQILASHAFLKAPNVQVGVRPNGAFGSTTVPAGFNPTSSPCLGFIVSRNNDGFPGSQRDGDFFCPGNPIEGWMLSVNGSLAINRDSSTSIPGALGSLVVGPPTHSVTWTSTAPFHGISVSQVYAVADAGQTLTMTATLRNATGADIHNVQFARYVDPDNATNSDVYNSTNKVHAQGAGAQVTASFGNGAILALSSTDPRTVAARSPGHSPPLTPDAILNGGGWSRDVGTSATADALIGLAFDIGTIRAGQSETIVMSYPLTAAALPAAGPQPVPTLSEWAMILFGAVLAGGAALHIQRRRLTA